MTNKVVFSNSGEIDLRAVTTMGVSVKDDSAIGYFGTGLKYALAVLLRNNCHIIIYSGDNEHHFTQKETEIRGKKFGIVCMDGQELGFTTDLGKNWEMWMAVREILCNCTDENGEHDEVDEDQVIVRSRGTTKIIIKGEKFLNEYRNRASFILNHAPKWSCGTLQIIDKPSNDVFYKGIKVGELPKQSCFTYNILDKLTLTEDRTYKSTFELRDIIVSGIKHIDNIDIIDKIIKYGEGTLEQDLDWSDTFYEQHHFSEDTKDYIKTKGKDVTSKIPPTMRSAYCDRVSDSLLEKPLLALNKVQESMFNKALAFLAFLGYKVDIYEIRIVEAIADKVMGGACRDNNIIFISSLAFDMGTKYLAATLFEEYIHLKHGVNDETRMMQDVLIQCMLSAGELALGEPL